MLGEPEERLYVELVPNGGAFGGKEDMTIQAQTALLARLTGRPVRIVLSREESMRLHPKRHPMTMTYTVGCDAEGRLTAVKADILGDSGAYASVGGKVLERAAGHACGPYRVPAVDIESVAAYTNNPPCGAMRGFGVNQTSFAIEGCLDLLAAKVGLDGWEMRWRNIVRVGDVLTTGQILEKSVGLDQTLLAVKPAYDGGARRRARRRHRLRPQERRARQRRDRIRQVPAGRRRPDGTIDLHTGFTEMGQGLLTILTQCAVEITGLPAAIFRPQVNSTFEVGAGQTTGSRATLLAGRATVDAAREAQGRSRRRAHARRAGRQGLCRRSLHRRHHRRGRDQERQDQDPHHLRLRHAGRRARRAGRAGQGDRRPRRRPGDQSAVVRGAD